MFSNIGMPEILLILLICLLLFGAKRLPEMGSSIGKGIREFKRSITDTSDAIMGGDEQQRTNLPPRQMDSPAQPTTPPTSGEPKRLSQ